MEPNYLLKNDTTMETRTEFSTEVSVSGTKDLPEVLPASDFWLEMTPYAGLVAGGLCGIAVIILLYTCFVYQKRRRCAKVRRHVSLMQASDASLHTPAFSMEIPSPSSHSDPRMSIGFPQLIGARPRQPSIDGNYSNSGITLKAEVLDQAYYNGTIKKTTRMNQEFAQAIAALKAPKGAFNSLRKGREKQEDKLELSSNMEVVYQERTAV